MTRKAGAMGATAYFTLPKAGGAIAAKRALSRSNIIIARPGFRAKSSAGTRASGVDRTCDGGKRRAARSVPCVSAQTFRMESPSFATFANKRTTEGRETAPDHWEARHVLQSDEIRLAPDPLRPGDENHFLLPRCRREPRRRRRSADQGPQPAVAVNAAASTARGAEQATLTRDDSAKPECRQVIVEIDEGYGVSGQVTRSVCRKAL